MTSEDKWKLVVISYREKMGRLEAKLEEQRRERELLEEEMKLWGEEKDRLTKLNNIKFNKINALMH
jgi:hypothetical protein